MGIFPSYRQSDGSWSSAGTYFTGVPFYAQMFWIYQSAPEIINTDSKFTVAAATGNTDIEGTLDVTGTTTLDNTLSVTGATYLASSLSVTGATTLAGLTAGESTIASADVTNNATVGGTLGISGNTTVGGNLTVDDVTMSTKIHAGPAGPGGHTTSPVCSLCVSHTSDVVVADSSYTQNAMNFWQQDQTDNNWSTVVFQSGNNTVSGYGSAGRIGFQYLDHSVPGAYGRISFAGRSSNGLDWNSDILSLESVSYTHLTLPTICSV